MSFSNEDFKTVEEGVAGLAIVKLRFELVRSRIKMLLKVLDVRREAERFISVSNLNELKGKGKTRYT